MVKKNKLSQKIIYVLILGLIIGISFFIFRPSVPTKQVDKQNEIQNTQSSNSGSSTVDKDKLLIGKIDAPVTLIEYLDFKCPNCGEFHMQGGKQIRQEYVDSGIVKIEVRAYPFLGPDSGRALRGAYCANELNSFTSYHDKVFDYMWEEYYKNGNYKVEIEDILTSTKLTEIAGLSEDNRIKFIECINSDTKNKLIDRDLEKAAKDSIQGTPTVIIGSKKIVGPQPFNIYKQLIDIENR